MVSEFTIQVQGDQALLEVLAALKGRAVNQRPAWDLIGAGLVANADKRFETKMDPTGTPWAPWADSTKRARQKSGRGTLLELTRMMRASLNHQAQEDGVVVGLGRSYAPYHETGTRNKDESPRMPRRGMLLASLEPPTLGREDRQFVLDTLMEFLHG